MEKRNFIVDVPVYGFEVMFSFGETDEDLLANKLLKKQKGWEGILNMPDTSLGRCIMTETNATLVRLPRVPECVADHGTLAHEIFHAAHMILSKVGIKLSFKSDEAFAHLIGYLTTKVYVKL